MHGRFVVAPQDSTALHQESRKLTDQKSINAVACHLTTNQTGTPIPVRSGRNNRYHLQQRKKESAVETKKKPVDLFFIQRIVIL